MVVFIIITFLFWIVFSKFSTLIILIIKKTLMAILTIKALTELIWRMCFVLKRYCVLYNFKYVKNAYTEKSEHKYIKIVRMVVQVVGGWDFFPSYICVQSEFKNIHLNLL